MRTCSRCGQAHCPKGDVKCVHVPMHCSELIRQEGKYVPCLLCEVDREEANLFIRSFLDPPPKGTSHELCTCEKGNGTK